MACCGQKRMAVAGDRYGATARLAGRGASGVASGPGQADDVVLRYRGAGTFSIRSPITGRAYGCASTGTDVMIDARDVAMLVRTGLFARQ